MKQGMRWVLVVGGLLLAVVPVVAEASGVNVTGVNGWCESLAIEVTTTLNAGAVGRGRLTFTGTDGVTVGQVALNCNSLGGPNVCASAGTVTVAAPLGSAVAGATITAAAETVSGDAVFTGLAGDCASGVGVCPGVATYVLPANCAGTGFNDVVQAGIDLITTFELLPFVLAGAVIAAGALLYRRFRAASH